MRSLYSKDIIENPFRVSPFQQRSRLRSLKELRQLPFEQTHLDNKNAQQHILQLLEKKLVQENYKQQNQEVHVLTQTKKHSLHVASKHFMKEESEKKLNSLKLGNKLCQYFEELYKKQIPADKVEREKVNFCQKQFEEIKNTVHSKLQLNRKKLTELQETVKEKYLQLHEYHEQAKDLCQQIKDERKLKQSLEQQKKQRQLSQAKSETKMNSSNMTLKPPSLKQKLYVMEQTISHLKQQTSKLQEQVESINNKEVSIKEEWIMFLKLFLNSGYYLMDGCEKVLKELKKLGVQLSKDDLMTEMIDENAKKFLLAYYRNYDMEEGDGSKRDNFNEFSCAYNTLSKEDLINRERIKSTIEMNTLTKEGNLKNIYSNTKSAMMNLLKNSHFRAPSENKPQKEHFLPKIEPRKHSVTNNNSRVVTLHDHETKGIHDHTPLSLEELKKQEMNRINHIYGSAALEERGRLLKRILFGFNVK